MLSGQLGPDAQGHLLAQDLGTNVQIVLPAECSHSESGAPYFLGQGTRLPRQ
ncbi:hypothetical protein DPMN_003256 [Dreissena polymorpha]|uniref:Uncharacterized protein n=1 Tax=Dreissena polymorpha TaxID=45954 RepID=A0A9D4F463_DREPO|nr:hypothetical protein DPMN_193360 [Dreissena polymorpha]KAH3727561.1 hypothetical protein DPMN_053500 [Dreissena polymorpha]KAH3790979.1 hypothetical protein DPMN_169188 [Dreissena polymorpha]KAH3879022.1 hypothetical protein DPMN_002923 [Dreissena polymorpha]KAH3879354.1 hypothetical protein DPMN_003256 [Dreissena polymorpha]